MNNNTTKNQFSFISPELDTTLTEIKKKIRLSMSGVTADKMKENGLVYKKNYGVSIIRIKELASGYTPSAALANQLWRLKTRETMIMSTCLFPLEKLNPTSALAWIDDVDNTELAEQITMNLLSKLDFASALVTECINGNDYWRQVVGFMLCARVWSQLSSGQVQQVVLRAKELSISDDFQLYKSAGVALARLCRRDKLNSELILSQVSDFHDSKLMSQVFIFKQVEQEILFLGY